MARSRSDRSRRLRDFNYVADTVSGFLRVAESDAAIGEVINIGSGREVSIGEIVDQVKTLVGRDFAGPDRRRAGAPGAE